MDEITPAEERVMSLYKLGFSCKYIAGKLHISARTVETHMGRIYQKLGVSDRDSIIEMYHKGSL